MTKIIVMSFFSLTNKTKPSRAESTTFSPTFTASVRHDQDFCPRDAEVNHNGYYKRSSWDDIAAMIKARDLNARYKT